MKADGLRMLCRMVKFGIGWVRVEFERNSRKTALKKMENNEK